MYSPVEGPRRTVTSHLLIKSLELMCHAHIFLLRYYISAHGRIFIRYYSLHIYLAHAYSVVCILCVYYICVCILFMYFLT